MMLNQIGDEAAADMLEFYRSLLGSELKESGSYEAHFSIALLLWRGQGNAAAAEIREHFQQAATVAAHLYSTRAHKPHHTDGLFEFMFPLFVIYIFGGREDRRLISRLQRSQWAPEGEDQYESLIALFELLYIHAETRNLAPEQILAVLQKNKKPVTHPFYREWIDAVCHGLLAIGARDSTALAIQAKTLLGFSEEESYDGAWCRLVEGLMAFWPLVLKVTAETHGVAFSLVSPYLPDFALNAN
jgi:hypothetical protein